MIPKIIHYCWFGPKEMPKDQREYIKEWKQLMPDYKFILWSEKDIDIKSIPFTRQAYEQKKFAYVADYVRIYALYNVGGIYMDTDVKLKSQLDEFLKYGVFTSYECAPARKDIPKVKSMLTSDGNRVKPNECTRIPGIGLFSALIAAEKGHPFIKDNLDYYNSHSFEEVWRGELTVPNILAYHAEKYGFKYKNMEQHLKENMVIFDYTIFASKLHANKKSLAVHYCAASWKNRSIIQRVKGFVYEQPIIRFIIEKLFPKY